MEVIRDFSKLNNVPTAVIIGKFDGVHMGHRSLVRKLISVKGDNKTVVLTFDLQESVDKVVSPEPLCSEVEKEKAFETLGIDYYVLYKLDERSSKLSPEEFIGKVLIDGLNCKVIVCGNDFRFGINRTGDTKLLSELSEKYGYSLYVIEKEKYKGEEVSSTRIRKLISTDKSAAMKMLCVKKENMI